MGLDGVVVVVGAGVDQAVVAARAVVVEAGADVEIE